MFYTQSNTEIVIRAVRGAITIARVRVPLRLPDKDYLKTFMIRRAKKAHAGASGPTGAGTQTPRAYRAALTAPVRLRTGQHAASTGAMSRAAR